MYFEISKSYTDEKASGRGVKFCVIRVATMDMPARALNTPGQPMETASFLVMVLPTVEATAKAENMHP